MKKIIFILSTLFFAATIYSCSNKGCTDPFALNFDIAADKDDGSCNYENEEQINSGNNGNTNVGGGTNTGGGGGGTGGGGGGGGTNPSFTATVGGNSFVADAYLGSFAQTYRTVVGRINATGEEITVAYVTNDPLPVVGSQTMATVASKYKLNTATPEVLATSGTFEVTAVNTTAQTFSGTFSMVVEVNGTPVQITNGQFNNSSY